MMSDVRSCCPVLPKTLKKSAICRRIADLHSVDTAHHTGCWRSYKTFGFHGEVKHHGATDYRELAITEEGSLVLRSFSATAQRQVLEKGAWQLCAEGKRRFLYLGGKKAFEVITLEATDLVLQDPVSGEKIFFAAVPLWQERTRPRDAADRDIHITLWSKSLIEIITRDN